jgi:hypothetical protein
MDVLCLFTMMTWLESVSSVDGDGGASSADDDLENGGCLLVMRRREWCSRDDNLGECSLLTAMMEERASGR